MSLWKNIKAIWNPRARAESIIELQVRLFVRNKAQYPERDPNAWLALTLRTRTLPSKQVADFLYYSETALYSLAPEHEAAVALGIYMIHKEEPGLAERYEGLFERIMSPIYQLVGTDEILALWRSANPWTAKNFAEVVEAIRRAPRPALDYET